MGLLAFAPDKPQTITLRTPEEIKRFKDANFALDAKEREAATRLSLVEQRNTLLANMQPVGSVVRLASIRRVTPTEDHYGYWVPLPKEGYLAQCGSAMDKAKFTSGYATSYCDGAWVGNHVEDVEAVLTAWRELPNGDALARFQSELMRLEAGEVAEIFFDHPHRPGTHPVYVIDPPYMRLLHELICCGESPVSWSSALLHADTTAGYQWNRLPQLGDIIVVETTEKYGREISHYIPGSEKKWYRYL